MIRLKRAISSIVRHYIKPSKNNDMTKKIVLFILLLPLVTHGQDCSCESNFNWVKTTFVENDAGFAYALETKGQTTYDNHNTRFLERAKGISDSFECNRMLYEWLTFFRSGHIAIRSLGKQLNGGSEEAEPPNDAAIRERYKDSERLTVNLEEFKQYLAAKKEIDYEGIWVSEPYTIGIKKDGNIYKGFIVEADSVYWTTGQIKLKIMDDGSSTFYMRDHSVQNFDRTDLIGKNYLQIGFVNLKRIAPTTSKEPEVERYFQAISAENPYFEKINDNTTLLRIPRFWASEKKKIDSVIDANRSQILGTPNLIVDLRNNGGGSDSSFQQLLPILYSNPIRTVGVELLSTPLNNQRMLDFINKDEYGFDEDGKKWAQESYDKLSKQVGKFVNIDTTVVSIDTYDTIHPLPRNIGIIINENNGSTTEQFLLAAKQSKKVKLFGTTTAGVLDISNMYFVKSPCEEFELGYSLSRSMRIPEMTIDDKGIQPDYYIAKDIPKYQWIQFVTKVLKEQ